MPAPTHESKLFIGVAGWSYPDWEGIVYPRPKPRGFDPLVYLADYIDLIEINSTYYHPGPAKNPLSWARRLAGRTGFRFTVKLWQKLTHERTGIAADDIKAARQTPELLAEAGLLGCVLAQFPWSFKNDPEGRRWIAQLANWFGDLRLAVELRHGGWDRPEVFQMCADLGLAFVNLDQPLIGDSLPPTAIASGPVAYARLHGRNRANWFKPDAGRDDRYNYLYTKAELEPWRERIASLSAPGREVYVVANNHYKGQALVNALQLKLMFGQEVAPPPALAAAYPGLRLED